MAKKQAEIEASITGQSQVIDTAKRIGVALKANFGNLGKSIGADLGLVKNIIQAGGAFKSASLDTAVAGVKQLDAVTARLSQTSGMSSATLKSAFNGVEKQILVPANAAAEFAESLGQATYDGKFAAESIGALGENALALGRDLGSQLPLGMTLKTLGVTSANVRGELGRVVDIAQKFETVGGPAALQDMLVAIEPQLAQFSFKTKDARASLLSLLAAGTKGMSPQRSAQVAGGALAQFQSSALTYERLTGMRILDDDGRADASKFLPVMKKLEEQVARTAKRGSAAYRRILLNKGAVGTFILNSDFNKAQEVAETAEDKGTQRVKADTYKNEIAAKRDARSVQLMSLTRSTAEKTALPAADDAEQAAINLFNNVTGGKDSIATRWDEAKLQLSIDKRIDDEKGTIYRRSAGYLGGDKTGREGHAEYLKLRDQLIAEKQQDPNAQALLKAVQGLPAELATALRPAIDKDVKLTLPSIPSNPNKESQ